MMQQITQAILEGNTAKSSPHAQDDKFHRFFDMVTDWVGLLDQCSKFVKEMHVRINKMYAESHAIVDLVEKATNFTEI